MNVIFDFLWVLVTLAAIILVVVAAILVTMMVRNRSEARRHANTGVEQPGSGAVPSASTAKERLQELESLRASGAITPEEHAAARDRILGEL